MKLALKEAEKAYLLGEVPVGAIITDIDGNIISSAHNLVESKQDPSMHAELIAIKDACEKMGSKNLSNCYIYVTLEPCPMCASLISYSRISRLYFGAYDSKMGGVESHSIFTNKTLFMPEIYGGIEEKKASELLKKFFKDIRNKI